MPYLNDGTQYDFMTLKLRGPLNDQRERLEIMQRPGIDGVRARKMGKAAEASMYVGVLDVETSEEAQTRRKAIEGLRGSLITLQDDMGESESDVLVKEATLVEFQRVSTAVGGLEDSSDRWVLTFAFEFVLTAVA